MYFQQLKNIMISNDLNQAELAKRAGVSRAAVTKWFRQGGRDGWVNAETRTVFALARALHVEPSFFFIPQEDLSGFESRFLWDHLYPSMERFLKAAIDGELQALARLTDVLGFHEAKVVAGRKIITQFSKYKRFLPPGRRQGLETLWSLYNSNPRDRKKVTRSDDVQQIARAAKHLKPSNTENR